MDGEALNRRRPQTFHIPHLQERKSVRVGQNVKIGVQSPNDNPGERFWVIVRKRLQDRYCGTVNNDLVYTDIHGLKDTDPIEFGPEHILDIL